MRRPIFGWGSVQLFGSAALMLGVGVLAGAPGAWRWWPRSAWRCRPPRSAWRCSPSATSATTAGQGVFRVALLQDIAAIPMLALVPLLAVGRAGTTAAAAGSARPRRVGVIAAIVLGGRLLLRPALRWIARSQTPEIFTAAALLLVVATAALMHSVGLSMALGAFLAGVLLAESEYRRELETDLEPFKGLLLGLFFIAVGMGIDFDVVMRAAGLIAGIVIGFVVLKSMVLWAMARRCRFRWPSGRCSSSCWRKAVSSASWSSRPRRRAGVIERRCGSLLVAVVTVSMLLTPLLLVAADRWWRRAWRAPRRADGRRSTKRRRHR